jgi:transposase InsO family protein
LSWSLDFVSDQFTDGRRFRVLAVVDDCTRENLALIADTSLSGVQMAREPAQLVTIRGRLQMIVSEFERSEIDPVDRFPRERQRIHRECHPEVGR